jgi:ATP-dependent RNA helicase DDX52/ROK1
LAVLLPLFTLLERPQKKLRVVVVCPSRELGLQIVRESERFLEKCSRKFKVSWLGGGIEKGKKLGDMLVCTPVRLASAVEAGEINLSELKMLVFDEADRLAEEGEEMGLLVGRARSEGSAQVVFLSATLASAVLDLAGDGAVRVQVGGAGACVNVSQRLLFSGTEEGKLAAFRQLVREGGVRPPTLVFVQSKERAKELCGELLFEGVMVECMHGDRKASERDRTVQALREGKIWVLICTDLMARGIDFKGVEMVINYDLPDTRETYIHRIGRTGRAKLKGEAITFFTEEDARKGRMAPVVSAMKDSNCEVPHWLEASDEVEKGPAKRRRISTDLREHRRVR